MKVYGQVKTGEYNTICTLLPSNTKKAFVNNIYINPFWWYMRHRDYDLIKFDFFQNLSSIGGFMQLLIYGGGKLSIDGRIKNE